MQSRNRDFSLPAPPKRAPAPGACVPTLIAALPIGRDATGRPIRACRARERTRVCARARTHWAPRAALSRPLCKRDGHLLAAAEPGPGRAAAIYSTRWDALDAGEGGALDVTRIEVAEVRALGGSCVCVCV